MRHLLLITLVGLVATTTLADKPAELRPGIAKERSGIAKEKPASGPAVLVADGYMVTYSVTIPGTDIRFEMVPVPGGEFLMGSPDDEAGRRDDEGPQVKVAVDPMWVAKTEVTWQQYKEFMNLYDTLKEFQMQGIRLVGDNETDAVTAPTPLYDETFTFEFGQEDQQPAVTMSQYGAQQFTEWLSRLTDQQFRLPTEAEWEYAARAGTTTAYYFGDLDEMENHAWFFDNADDGAGHVGTRKANAFGLHDMLGNAAEWTMNQYTANGYESYSEKSSGGKSIKAIEMIEWPVNDSSCVVRGGSWQMEPEELRVAKRLESDYNEWKDTDPQSPKSPWWMTDYPVRGVGFRLFRSYHQLPQETINRFWEANAEETQYQVKFKLDEGRAIQGVVDKTLPAATKALK